MLAPKLQLVHSVWDIHREDYSQRPVNIDPKFASQMAANIFCPGPSYYYILDFATREFTYVSPAVEEILGVNPAEYSLNALLERVHPEDIPHVTKCEGKIIDFLFNKIRPDQMTRYKFSYCLRIRHTDGTYKLILHQAIAISQDGFGRMSKVLDVDTDIGHLTQTNNYRLSIIGLQGEPSFLNIDPNKEDDQNYQQPIRPFSEREQEIIRLFADGLTAEEVAKTLSISTGTVRTHRQNVLNKSGCRNMTALVAKCIREGIV